MNLAQTKLESINVEKVGGDFILYYKKGGQGNKTLKYADRLEFCGGDFYAFDSNLKSAKSLKFVGRNMNVSDCPNLVSDSFNLELEVKGKILY